jgi:hypothetical protein
MSYGGALFVDVICLAICGVGLFRFGRLSHSHPATIYLVFHVYTFTWRLVALMNGAHTLLSDSSPIFQPVTEAEIVRAAILADVALIGMTLACLLIAQRERESGSEKFDSHGVMLDRRIIWGVVAVSLPLGAFGMLSYSVVPETFINPALSGDGVAGTWGGSSYLAILPTWPGLSLLVLIYYHGFRRWLVAPMVVYLLIMSIQGYHRFRVIIPVILLIQIHLDRRGRRWPGLGGVAILLALGMAFFPLKVAGKMVQQGSSVAEIAETSAQVITEAGEGQAADQQFLDQFAASLSLVDDTGTFFYGKPFLSVLTLPIPREWWPNKPGLADHIAEMSTPARPMGETGMILTYIGDAYANFGYAGAVVFPFVLGYWLCRVYVSSYQRPYLSLLRFCYLMVACNLIQVFRDGIISIVIFTAVQMMPLVVIVLLHKRFARFEGDVEVGTHTDAGLT